MKAHRLEIVLDCPIDHAWETFSNPELMKQWVQGFVGMQHVSGEAEQPGAVYELTFQEGKRTVVLMETVLALDPPRHFAFTATAPGMRSECSTALSEEGSATRIVADNQFYATSWILRLMMPLMGGAFRKRIEADFARLKVLAEQRFQDHS